MQFYSYTVKAFNPDTYELETSHGFLIASSLVDANSKVIDFFGEDQIDTISISCLEYISSEIVETKLNIKEYLL